MRTFRLRGRIATVADVLDALSMARPYKKPYSFDDSVAYILKGSGAQFDPRCCDVLREHRADFEAVYHRFEE